MLPFPDMIPVTAGILITTKILNIWDGVEVFDV